MDFVLWLPIPIAIVVGVVIFFFVPSLFSGKKEAQKSGEKEKGKERGKEKEKEKEKKKAPAKKEARHACEVSQLKGHEGGVLDVCWSPNGDHIASIGRDRTLRVWERQYIHQPIHRNVRVNIPFDNATACCFCHDSAHLLLSLESSKEISVVRITKKKEGNSEGTQCHILKTLPAAHNDRTIVSISVPMNSPYYLTCGNGEEIILSNLKGDVLHREATRQMTNYMATLSNDGAYALVATFSAEVRVYEIKKAGEGEVTMKRLMVLLGHKGAVFWCDVSHDSRRAVTTSKDGTWKLWKMDMQYKGVENPECLLTVTHPQQKCFHIIKMSPNGKYVIAISNESQPTIYVYTINGKLIEEIPAAHTMQCSGVAWDPSSALFATSSEDKTVKVWNPFSKPPPM